MSASLQLRTKQFTAGVSADAPLVLPAASRRYVFIVNTGGAVLNYASGGGNVIPVAEDYYPIPVGGHRVIECGNGNDMCFWGGGVFVVESDILPTGKQLANYAGVDALDTAYTGHALASAVPMDLNDCSFTFTAAGFQLRSGWITLFQESNARSVQFGSNLEVGPFIKVKNSANLLDVVIPLNSNGRGDTPISMLNSKGPHTVTVTLRHRAGNLIYADVVVDGKGMSGEAPINPEVVDRSTLGTINATTIFGGTSGLIGPYQGKFLQYGLSTNQEVVLDCPMVEANAGTQLSVVGPDVTLGAVTWAQVYHWR